MLLGILHFLGLVEREPEQLTGGKVDALTEYNPDQVVRGTGTDKHPIRRSATYAGDGVTPAITISTTQATGGGGSSCDPPSSSFGSGPSGCEITSDPWASMSLRRGPSL